MPGGDLRETADVFVQRAEEIETRAVRVIRRIASLSTEELLALAAFCSTGGAGSYWMSNAQSPDRVATLTGITIGFMMIGVTSATVVIYRVIRRVRARAAIWRQIKWLDERARLLATDESEFSNEASRLKSEIRRLIRASSDVALEELRREEGLVQGTRHVLPDQAPPR